MSASGALRDVLLEVKDLHVECCGREIIHGVSFLIRKGEIHVLLGPNGSGKSTILNTILGLSGYHVTRGEIWFKGQNITNLQIWERARLGLGIMFQKSPGIPGLTLDTLVKTAFSSKTSQAVIREAAATMNMSDFLKREVNVGFSGGELKRSELFQLLLQNPDMLLLDEPESGVDLENIHLVGNAVHSLQLTSDLGDRSALVITHTGIILKYLPASLAHVMFQGRIRAQGNTDRLLEIITHKGYSECIRHIVEDMKSCSMNDISVFSPGCNDGCGSSGAAKCVNCDYSNDTTCPGRKLPESSHLNIREVLQNAPPSPRPAADLAGSGSDGCCMGGARTTGDLPLECSGDIASCPLGDSCVCKTLGVCQCRAHGLSRGTCIRDPALWSQTVGELPSSAATKSASRSCSGSCSGCPKQSRCGGDTNLPSPKCPPTKVVAQAVVLDGAQSIKIDSLCDPCACGPPCALSDPCAPCHEFDPMDSSPECELSEFVDLKDPCDDCVDEEEESSTKRTEVEEIAYQCSKIDSSVIVNGEYIQLNNSFGEAAGAYSPGIEVMNLADAVAKIPGFKEKYLWKVMDPNKDDVTRKVAESEKDHFNGYVIIARAGARCPIPVRSNLLMDCCENQIVHNIMVAEAGSELSVSSFCRRSGCNHCDRNTHYGISEFFVEEGAQLCFNMIHNYDPNYEIFPRSASRVLKDGVFISSYVCLEPVKSVQMAPTAFLDGENAIARFCSILVSKDANTTLDIGSTAFLRARGCRTEMVARALTRSGHIVNRGRIVSLVPETFGHIECQGLVLGEGTIRSIPEIEAGPDAELSHEASVGKVDQDKIDYVMSRGVKEEDAIATIVRGFLDVNIKGIPPALQAEIDAVMEEASHGL